jgi:HEXXH motif-containing protein
VEPQNGWQFEPDPSRAAQLSAEIHLRLIQSLDYVFGEVGDELGCAAAAASWLDGIRKSSRLPPLAHTLFHSLVAEVEAANPAAARGLASRLLTVGPASDGLSLHALEDDSASDHPLGLFSRFADLEEQNRLDFTAPGAEAMAAFRRLFDEGWELVVKHDPALAGEFRGFVTELLIAGQAPSHRFTTAAVSCFQNWGGLIVNPGAARDPLDVVELVAHEATHLLLFALALDEPLLTNPPLEQYHSPLRQAPRSMDGVYHATIVAARVARAMLRQADGQGAAGGRRQAALERAQRAAELFDEGLSVVESAGVLTPTGRVILDECIRFINRVNGEIGAAASAASGAGDSSHRSDEDVERC